MILLTYSVNIDWGDEKECYTHDQEYYTLKNVIRRVNNGIHQQIIIVWLMTH